MRTFSCASAALCLMFVTFGASAQQDLEPAVQTSPPAARSGTAPPAPSPSATVSPGTAPPGVAATPGTSAGNDKASRARAGSAAAGTRPAAPAAAPAAAAATAPRTGKAGDRIELDTTQISGNRELPKVMYVVPWRRADPGEFTGRPLNSLLDEALTPVDRDVFRRQNRYYAALQGEPGSAKSQPGAAGDGAAAPTPKDEK
jgi:hypothetical protein